MMSTITFIEILDKLPVYRKREVFNFLEFIYQKTIKEEMVTKQEQSKLPLKESESSISIEEVKRKLKIKYGL